MGIPHGGESVVPRGRDVLTPANKGEWETWAERLSDIVG